jgi:hypothetical protein
MRASIVLLLLIFSQTCMAQIRVTNLGKSSIPNGIQYAGHIVKAVSWTDKMGENIVIATETGETQRKNLEEAYRDAALFAYHYLKKGSGWTLNWKVQDYIKQCPVDIKANYVKDTFAVTDLNMDGLAEIWLMYKTICRGDITPSNMKIIMYENGRKYAVRGTNRVEVSKNEIYGGKYTFDEPFKKGPEVFRIYAAQLWKKNLIEKFD